MMERYETYKDSGVEWIEEIPVDWQVVKLSYGFQLIGSGTTPTAGEQKYYFNGESPWIVTGDLRDCEIIKPSRFITREAIDAFSALKLFPANTLLIAMYGATIGKVGILKFPAYTNQACCALAEPSLFYERYVFYWFLGFRGLILSYRSGGGQPNISQDLIRSLRLHCPPKDEQTTIANYLDFKTAEIDELIAQKERLLALYEEEKTAIINHAVTKGLDPNAELKDSGVEWLGKIPVGWEVKKLKYLLKKSKGAIKTGPFGSQIKNSDLIPSGEFKVYTQRNVLDEDYAKGEDRIDYEKFNTLKEFEVKSGDILFTTRGTIGRCSLFPSDMERGVLHPCLIRIQIAEQLILLKWIVTYVNNSSFFIENVKLESNSTIIDVIYGGTLKEIVFPMPPKEEQTVIANYLDRKTAEIDAKIAKTQRIIELQKEYRTALISELVTGKIKVSHLTDEEVT